VDSPGDAQRHGVPSAVLPALLRAAIAAAGSNRDLWTWEHAAGDALGLLPPRPAGSGEPPAPQLLGAFVRALGDDLARYNQARDPGARLRVRVAVRYRATAAVTAGTDQGLITAAQLLDEPPIRRALAASRGAGLAVIMSGEVFEDIIRPGGPGLCPGDFCKVAVKTTTSSAEAWLHLPGLRRDAGRPLGHRPPPGCTPPGLAAGQRGAGPAADGGRSAAAGAAGDLPGPPLWWGEAGVPRGDRDAGARAPHATGHDGTAG